MWTIYNTDIYMDELSIPQKKAGYEYLLTYKITVPIYDYTVKFANRYLPFSDSTPYNLRTHDQMVQAARSGMQNIVEGNKQKSLKGYIFLTGISRGSLEELLLDYKSYARQNNVEVLPKEDAIRQIREIGEVWNMLRTLKTLPDSPNFPPLPPSSLHAVNMMITLTNQANYLIDRLIESLKERHMKIGGLTEELYQKRKKYRGY